MILFLLIHVVEVMGTMCALTNDQTVDSWVRTVYWQTPETAFFTTTTNGVYVTNDAGRTLTSLLPLLAMAEEPVEESGRGTGVRQVLVRKEYVLFNGWYTRQWVKEGDAYRKVQTDVAIDRVVGHPTRDDVLLGQARGRRVADPDKVLSNQDYRAFLRTAPVLAVSKDRGASWSIVLDHVYGYKFDFGAASNGMDPALWVIEPTRAAEGILDGDTDPYDLNLVSSDNEFATPGVVRLEHTVDFVMDWGQQFCLAATLRDRLGDALQLYTSSDTGKTFVKTTFPSDLEEGFYTFLDRSEARVFMHVRESYVASSGSLFASSALGKEFELVLEHVSVYASSTEFRRFRGIDGVFVANQVVVPGTEESTRVGTVISTDMGQTWKPIDVKHVRDLDGLPVECKGQSIRGCSLHFGVHGKPTSGAQRLRGAFHSSWHAPGVAVAVGNVGPWYDRDEADESLEHWTFLTRDAGVSWTRIRRGSHVAEIGDQGSLIVLADDREFTTELIWSGDGGMTWTACSFSNVPLLVNNIVSEPSTTGTTVLLLGTRVIDGRPVGAVVHVDLSQYAQECTASDYETWTLTGVNDCFLGERTSYQRKKAGAECHSDRAVARQSTPCKCGPEDYGCSACYVSKDGTCSRIVNPECPEVLPEPKDCATDYRQSRGYTKIPGNKCSPNLDSFEPVTVMCADVARQSDGGGGAWVAVVLILLFLGATAGVVVWQYKSNQTFHRWVRQLRLPFLANGRGPMASSFADEDGLVDDDDLLDDTGDY